MTVILIRRIISIEFVIERDYMLRRASLFLQVDGHEPKLVICVLTTVRGSQTIRISINLPLFICMFYHKVA